MTKYIVYLTVNKVNNKIYIGVHKTISDKFDGYLGCGVKIKDRSSYHQCKTPFQMAVTKYGVDNFIRYTLDEFDNLEDALELEKLLVDEEFIKRKDTYNIALGGNVPPVISKFTYQYSLDGEFIKEWESITEASIQFKCSQSSIGKAIFERTPSCGFLWSLDKFDKIFCMDTKNYQDVLSLAESETQKNKVSMILEEAGSHGSAEVPDPYYGTMQDFENVFQMLDEACEIIAEKYDLK